MVRLGPVWPLISAPFLCHCWKELWSDCRVIEFPLQKEVPEGEVITAEIGAVFTTTGLDTETAELQPAKIC